MVAEASVFVDVLVFIQNRSAHTDIHAYTYTRIHTGTQSPRTHKLKIKRQCNYIFIFPIHCYSVDSSSASINVRSCLVVFCGFQGDSYKVENVHIWVGQIPGRKHCEYIYIYVPTVNRHAHVLYVTIGTCWPMNCSTFNSIMFHLSGICGNVVAQLWQILLFRGRRRMGGRGKREILLPVLPATS